MGADRWQRLNEIFHAALALEPGERSAFVAQACAGDESLRLESEGLIQTHEQAELDLGAIERFEAALDEPASPGLAGLRLGPYRISEEIGRGGMSAVWLADRVDGQFEQHVAIKVIKRGMDTAQVLEKASAPRSLPARRLRGRRRSRVSPRTRNRKTKSSCTMAVSGAVLDANGGERLP